MLKCSSPQLRLQAGVWVGKNSVFFKGLATALDRDPVSVWVTQIELGLFPSYFVGGWVTRVGGMDLGGLGSEYDLGS